MSGEMDRYFHSRRALKKRVDEQNAEITTLRGQIRDLQRTVAFFASVIKSGEGWTEQCDRAWPVTLEPCAHDFHRAEHGVMPCTKCGAEPPPASARDAVCAGTGPLLARVGEVLEDRRDVEHAPEVSCERCGGAGEVGPFTGETFNECPACSGTGVEGGGK